MVGVLDSFSSSLVENWLRFTNEGDIDGAGIIWTSCIICLAHLAALSHLTSQVDPASSMTMSCLYALTLDKLEKLSLEAHIEEYLNFDVLTEVRILQQFISPNEVRLLSLVSRFLGKEC